MTGLSMSAATMVSADASPPRPSAALWSRADVQFVRSRQSTAMRDFFACSLVSVARHLEQERNLLSVSRVMMVVRELQVREDSRER